MKSLITELNAAKFGQRVRREIEGCRTVDIPIETAAFEDQGSFAVGSRVQRLTMRFADRTPLKLDPADRQLFTALSKLRTELRRQGAGWIEPEVELAANRVIREPGRCDLLLHQRECSDAGAAKHTVGIAEIKVTDRVPALPSAASLLQAAAYAHMAAWGRRRRVWCVVVCVIGLKDRMIRCFQFQNSDALQEAAGAVLAN